MKNYWLLLFLATIIPLSNCEKRSDTSINSMKSITAEQILGNPNYLAISYGGYREITREIQPTIAQLKEDMLILNAMGVKLLRTYNVHLDQAANLLIAIDELKKEKPEFEMYVMLGAWIDAKNAWTDEPDRIRDQDGKRNESEIARAIELTNKYPEIVKIIAVGNEAMVKWAWEYYVEPSIILKWVSYLQNLKAEGKLPTDLWITSSDNFASWGGGDESYHVDDLEKLISAVDFLSVHTYPMHDTHYNPVFWGISEDELDLSDIEKVDLAMERALNYSIKQFNSVKKYMESLGVDKPIHIGETGWATISNEFYGADGAKAIDEYKSGVYFESIRNWSNKNNVSVFYFEAFDEKWKDAANQQGSENHFGLINLQSEAKYALWKMVDDGIFEGLSRDGKPIRKTFNGTIDSLMKTVLVPPLNKEILAN